MRLTGRSRHQSLSPNAVAVVLPQTYEAAVALDQLRLMEANPRQGDVGAIWESIEQNGFYGAVLVNRATGSILAGNHRYVAAKEAGLDELPVLYVEGGTDGKPLTDEAALRILLADNRTNDRAGYDNHTLADLLEHLASTDDKLAGTGYDGDDLDTILWDLGRDAPDFAPVSIDDQGRLDEKSKIECPECGHVFTP